MDDEPPQSLAGSFELQGNAATGQLQLFSPLGQTLAQLSWQPGLARLTTAGQTREHPSLDALALAATGTALPIAALFQWLRGEAASADGWQADLSRLDEGRLQARRRHPLPAAELRLVLER